MIKVYPNSDNQKQLLQVVDILKNGGVIIYPTDTCYALGCIALDERAVEKIYRIKGLDAKKHALCIICKDLSQISEYAAISNQNFQLLRRNLPGCFTFILPGLKSLPKIYKNKKKKEVGVRLPDNTVLLQLIELLDTPLLTSSLPLMDDEKEFGLHPELIAEKFGNIVDEIIDAGTGKEGFSTIVNCTNENIEIIRQGNDYLK